MVDAFDIAGFLTIIIVLCGLATIAALIWGCCTCIRISQEEQQANIQRATQWTSQPNYQATDQFNVTVQYEQHNLIGQNQALNTPVHSTPPPPYSP